MIKTTDEAGLLSQLAYHSGYVMGLLVREELIVYLMDRGVPGKTIETLKKELRTLSETFYRKD